jgi:hypothetical protein
LKYLSVVFVALIGLGVYIFFAASQEKKEPEKLSSSYLFDAELKRVYALKSSSKFKIYLDDLSTADDGFALEGVLNFRVLKKKDAKIFTLFQLSQLKIDSSNTLLNSELEKLYSELFVVVFSKDGEILEEYFKYKKEDYKGLMQLLDILQIRLRQKHSYELNERNTEGVVVSAYTRESNTIKKQRKRFVSMNESVLDYNISASNIDIEIDPHWIVSLDAQETLEIYENKHKILWSTNIYSIKQDERLYDPSLEIWRYQDSAEDLIKRYLKKDKLSYLKKIRQKAKKEFFQQNNIDINFIMKGISSYDDFHSLKELEEYITLYPESTHQLYGYIKNSQDRLSAHLINVLENSSTKEAQELLVKIASDSEFEHVDNLRAIIALGGVENPQNSSIEHLWLRYMMREDKEQKELSDTAILSLGALSKKAEDPQGIREKIRGAFYDAQSVSQKRAILLGMQNADSKEFSSEIDDALKDNNSLVRSTAVKALRSIDSDETREKLYALFDADEHRRVRKAILSTLRSIKTDKNLMQKARENLFKEDDNLIRKDIIKYLYKNKELYPQNIDTLQEFSPYEKDKENKNLLRDIL